MGGPHPVIQKLSDQKLRFIGEKGILSPDHQLLPAGLETYQHPQSCDPVIERNLLIGDKRSPWIEQIDPLIDKYLHLLLIRFLWRTLTNTLSHVILLLSLSVVSDSAIPLTAVRQTSLFSTVSRSLLKLMFTESVMASNHLILCHPLSSCLQSLQHQGLFQ